MNPNFMKDGQAFDRNCEKDHKTAANLKRKINLKILKNPSKLIGNVMRVRKDEEYRQIVVVCIRSIKLIERKDNKHNIIK